MRAATRLLLAVSLVAGAVAVSVADDPGVVEAAPRSQRVLMVSDSVGLGAKTALPAAFPSSWEVNVVGTPAMFVEIGRAHV